MSNEQKELRIKIKNSTNPEKRKKLKQERNSVLHSIQKRTQMLINNKLEAMTNEIENAKDCADVQSS